MKPEPRSLMVLSGAAAAAVVGVLFFFAIIGVFGMNTAILALVVFVVLTIVIVRRLPQKRVNS